MIYIHLYLGLTNAENVLQLWRSMFSWLIFFSFSKKKKKKKKKKKNRGINMPTIQTLNDPTPPPRLICDISVVTFRSAILLNVCSSERKKAEWTVSSLAYYFTIRWILVNFSTLWGPDLYMYLLVLYFKFMYVWLSWKIFWSFGFHC